MASLRQLFNFFFFFTKVVVLILLVQVNPSSSENVTVSLYYETLCPYCADFIVNQLVKVFENGLASIINLRLVPWGNALIQQDGTFVCQHGPDECFLNTIDACTITIYPDVQRHFRFVHCIESLALQNQLKQWVNCFDMSGLGKVPIDCYTSGYGKVLEQKYATETAQLNPPHRYVPWVVVNNQALQEDYRNFMSYICKAYRSSQVPEACKSLLPANESLQTASNTDNKVCYASKEGI